MHLFVELRLFLLRVFDLGFIRHFSSHSSTALLAVMLSRRSPYQCFAPQTLRSESVPLQIRPCDCERPRDINPCFRLLFFLFFHLFQFWPHHLVWSFFFLLLVIGFSFPRHSSHQFFICWAPPVFFWFSLNRSSLPYSSLCSYDYFTRHTPYAQVYHVLPD